MSSYGASPISLAKAMALMRGYVTRCRKLATLLNLHVHDHDPKNPSNVFKCPRMAFGDLCHIHPDEVHE
jgi:hypothetical protein